MAASGFTPISLYYSTTAAAVPTSGNLANGELGLNIADMKLYAKNSAGTVTLLASNAGASGSVTSVSGTGTVNGLTLTGTVTTSGSLTLGGTLSLVSPPAIGSTSPNTGAFTTLSSTGQYTNTAAFISQGSGGINFSGHTTQPYNITMNNTSGNLVMGVEGSSGAQLAVGSSAYAAVFGHVGNYPTQIFANNTVVGTFNSTGLGIGTSSPRGKVDVNGTLLVAGGGQIQITGSVSSTGLQLLGQDAAESAIGTMSSQALAFRTASSEKARFSAAGGFSVGTTADPGAGAIYATGAITAFYSDKRLKTVSGKIENALDKVGQLSGVYYTNNDTAKSFGYDSDEVQVGVIAQEVEAVLPQIVKAAPFDLDENGNSKSGQNYKTVQYEKLTPLLIEAINELRAEVTALKGTI